MKVVCSVLLVLGASDFLFAKDSKSTKSTQRYFYCVDAEAKATAVSPEGSAEIVNSCKDIVKEANDACIEKAKNAYCKGMKGNAPLFGSLREVPNKTTCTDFANKILANRGLGSLKKPDASVKTSMALTLLGSGQPNFHFTIVNPGKGPGFASANAIYASSKVDKKTTEETWTLTVAGADRVPSFEQRKEYGTGGAAQPGEYKRIYNFKVVNNVCALDSIKMEFTPRAPKGEEDYPKYRKQENESRQNDCEYRAQAFRGEKYYKQFGLTPEGDLLDNWVCNESVTAFNKSEAAEISNGARHRRGQGGKPSAERSR